MKIEVRYRTNYHYEQEVGFSPHTFRLFPKTDYFLAAERVAFTTNTSADVQYRRDIFDNPIAFCFYPERGTDLHAELSMTLRIREKNAFHFLLAPHALDLPFAYKPEERRALAPYLENASHLELPFWKFQPQSTVSALIELNDAIHEHIGYERRDEGSARSPAETIAAGSGACRDFAVLLAEILRGLGVASRLASGYLCEFGEKEKRAESALHAWTEAFLPGAGWIGLDPTNGIFCNHNHITTAVGITPEEIAPVTGSYYNKERVASEMTAVLDLIQCAE
jgi:transglutaminase-like putative cysteine protease